MLRKIKQIITPPPSRRKSASASATSSGTPVIADREIVAALKRLIGALVGAPPPDDASRDRILAEIRQIAKSTGLYHAAFQIKVQLDGMPRLDAEGNAYRKESGYLLSGEFIHAQILREIRALRTESRPIGPKVFGGYCSEMVSCYFGGRNPRRGVEAAIGVVEKLLTNAVEELDAFGAYLALATQTLKTTGALVREARVEPIGRPAQNAWPEDEAVEAYLLSMHRKLKLCWNSFSQYQARVKEEARREQGVAEALQNIFGAAQETRCRSLAALAGERLGQILRAADVNRAAMLLKHAAQQREVQGDQEDALDLHGLSAQRYGQAHQLLTKIGDKAAAAQVADKMGRAPGDR